MNHSNATGGRTTEGLTRRKVLSLGAGATGVALGLVAVPGSAAAWRRFDAEFVGCGEVRLVVHDDDLHFDPPAVAHVVVAADGETDCRPVEVTEGAATRMPDQYGDAPVITYSAGSGEKILGVIEYNYREDRFSEPACLLANDDPCATAGDAPDLRDASCVQAGKAGYWNGAVEECASGPIEGGGPVDDPDVDPDADPDLPPLQLQRIGPPDGSDSDRFGEAIGLSRSGDVLLVGAPDMAVTGPRSGAVHVYRQGGDEWIHSETITPDGGSDEDRFGAAVDLDASGDVALVGAPEAAAGDAGNGTAYLFEYDGSDWAEVERFRGQDQFADSFQAVGAFGDDVALDDGGETAVVGAPFSVTPGIHSGAAFAFERREGGWTEGTELTRPNIGDSQQFGRAVDVAAAGDCGVVGAPVPFPDTLDPEGYLGVYPRDGDWEPETFLQADAGQPGDELGAAAACNDGADLVVAGDPRDNTGGVDRSGRAKIFSHTGASWSEITSIEASDGTPGDGFGTAVATSGDGTDVIVGAPGTVQAADDFQEAVYAFRTDGIEWSETARIEGDGTNESFGEATALDSAAETAVVGAPDATVDGVDGGAVYVYRINR